MKTESIIEKKRLSYNLHRTSVDGFICNYDYKFRTNQWLESIDNPSFAGINHEDFKNHVIELLVEEFRHSLKWAIFGDPIKQTIKQESNEKDH